MRVLAIDHGEKRIGVAISDPTGTLARPLTIFKHVTRAGDAAHVLKLATEQAVTLIVVGQSTDEAGQANLAGRRAGRFAEALKSQTDIPVVLWDESMSTQDARQARIAGGSSRKLRRRDVDALAAAVILQSYLDEGRSSSVEAGSASNQP